MALVDLYPWLKALHVAAALVFVGGVLAATAFLSSIANGGELPPERRQAVVAFRRWDTLLTTSAMLLVWALGLSLAVTAGWFRSGWLPLKLVFVLLLSALHGFQSGTLRRLAGGSGHVRSQKSTTLVLLGATVCICLLAVTKPF